MHPALNRDLYLIKEHKGLFKAANNYDVHDPETGEIILHCREDSLGSMTKLFRFSKYKQMTPFNVEVRTPSGESIVKVSRGVSVFISNVAVHDETGTAIGGFKQKFFSIGGGFSILDLNGNAVCNLKGKWTGWEFSFRANNVELAKVSKKWAGLGKEFFTSADNYMLQISEAVPKDSAIRQLIIAAVVCIDMVLKE